ncbi:MAG: hypothetical protein AAF192_19615 [Pseudomonadota bacterium]
MALLTLGVSGAALADGHVAVEAADQSVAGGVVAAEAVMAEERGWLVVHRTDAQMKPGPVVGHAPLGPGLNRDVKALLTEPVAPGERLMLMIHSEAGGARPGIFEYVLGAKEDGPIREDGRLVMAVIEAQ